MIFYWCWCGCCICFEIRYRNMQHQLATKHVESRCYYHKRVARPSYTCSSSSCIVVHKFRSSRWVSIDLETSFSRPERVAHHIIIIYFNIAHIGTHSHEFQLVVFYICYKTIVCRCYSHASVARPHMLFIIVCWSSVNANVTGDLLLVLVWLLTCSSKSNEQTIYNMRLSVGMGS